MNKRLSLKTFNNQNKNKTITHSFYKLKNLILNKPKNENNGKKEYENKKDSSNSFRKTNLKFISKLDNKTINNKTQKLKKFIEQQKSIKIIKHKNLS